MPETTTSVKIDAKVRGFAKAQKDIIGLGKAGLKTQKDQVKGFAEAEKATSNYQKELGNLEKEFKRLTTEQAKAKTAMLSVPDKASESYKKLKKNFQEVKKEAKDVEQTIESLNKAFGKSTKAAEQAQRRGAFMQGLLQGSMPSAFIQRGPGMYRQAAGMAIGRAARGIASTPFTGLGGLTTALASNPITGILAGQLQTATGFAGQALQMQRQQVGMLPFLQGGDFGAIGRARRRAMARVQRRPIEFFRRAQSEVEGGSPVATAVGTTDDASDEYVARRTAAERARRLNISEELARKQMSNLLSRTTQQRAEKETKRQLARAREKDFQQRRQAAGAQAASKVRARLFGDIPGAGRQLLGVGRQEAMQQAAQLLQAGGGTVEEMQRQGMTQAGFAAQTLFGIQAPTAGAFMRAGRRGGLVGAQGRAGEAMTDAIKQGMELGLRGSELTDYMQQMAGDIRQWESTGMPINQASITSMAQTTARLGLGGVRGLAVARGIAGAGKRVAAGGVQSAADLLMMRSMYGFRGGGVEEYEKALEKMESSQVEPGGLLKMFQGFMGAGGGGAAGRFAFRGAMRRMGIQMGVKETRFLGGMLEKQRRGEALSPEEQQRLDDITRGMKEGEKAAPKTLEQLVARAAEGIKTMGPNLKRQANIADTQLKTGQKMLGVVQDLATSTTKINNVVAELSGEKLEKLTKKILEITEALIELTKPGGGLNRLLNAMDFGMGE